MNILSREKQIAVISALTEGMSIRATERLTGIHRDTIMRLAARVGRGCAELHDRLPQKIANSGRHLPRQHPLALFREPHKMNLEVVLRVAAKSISSHNATSCTLRFA